MATKRTFSKSAVEDTIKSRIDELAGEHGFTSYIGTYQISEGDSKERTLAYGQVMALENLLLSFGMTDVTYGRQR